jgi:hypothetical protein
MNLIEWVLHILTNFITDFFGALAAKQFADAAKEAATKAVKLDPDEAKRRFPHNVMTKSHQVAFGNLTDKLDDGLEKALEEYFFSKLGRNQRAHFIIRMAEWAETDEQAALRFLTRMAKRAGSERSDFDSMVRMAVSNDYMQPKETDYPVGWVMSLFGTQNLRQGMQQALQTLGWRRGLGLIVLAWLLLKSKPEDFAKAFDRVRELVQQQVTAGTNSFAALFQAVWQTTKELFGTIGGLATNLIGTTFRGAAWAVRYALGLIVLISTALLVIGVLSYCYPTFWLAFGVPTLIALTTLTLATGGAVYVALRR